MNHRAILSQPFKNWQLQRRIIIVAGLQTSIYGPKIRDVSKPAVLLIHGLGGDHHGMMPLAYELRLSHDVYIVELPGHGNTAIPEERSYMYWKQWSSELGPVLNSEDILISLVVAHSFGCMAASMMMDKLPVNYVFLNPVPRATVQFSTYARVMNNIRHLVSPFYGWYPFALARGITLAHVKTSRSLDTLSWISAKTAYSGRIFRYQMELSTQFRDVYLFSSMNDVMFRRTRILMGSHDTFSSEGYYDLRRDIPHARIILLPGGHLMPIETPHQVANELFTQDPNET